MQFPQDDVSTLTAIPKMNPSFRATKTNFSSLKEWIKESKTYLWGSAEDFVFNSKS